MRRRRELLQSLHFNHAMFLILWRGQRDGVLMILVHLKTQVIPNNTALEVTAGNSERHFIFARLQQCGVEPQRPLLP